MTKNPLGRTESARNNSRFAIQERFSIDAADRISGSMSGILREKRA